MNLCTGNWVIAIFFASKGKKKSQSTNILAPQLEMADGDTLEVHQEQVGGSGSA